MDELLETRVRRKFSALEDFARRTPTEGPDFFGLLEKVVLDALASHKTSTLKKIERELDTMAEEVFAVASAEPYQELYWEGAASVVEEEVKMALRERKIRDEDQARSILIYLDQISQNLRANFLKDEELTDLNALIADFETH